MGWPASNGLERRAMSAVLVVRFQFPDSTDFGNARVMLMSDVIFSGAGRPDGFVLVEAEIGSVAHPDRSATRMMSEILAFIFRGNIGLGSHAGECVADQKSGGIRSA